MVALTTTITKHMVAGDRRIVIGTAVVLNGQTTGTIVTGLNHIDYADVHCTDVAKNVTKVDFTTTPGTLDITYEDPTATKEVCFIAIGV